MGIIINDDLKLKEMRRSIILAVFMLASISVIAQNKAVDKLFEKYGGREGFTTVVISKHMFNLFSNVEAAEDDEYKTMMKKLNGIRILTGPEGGEGGVNFYQELMKNLPVDEYEELMTIQESDKNIKFLIKKEKGNVGELLMIVGGKVENVLISITGDIDMQSVAKLSKSMGIEGLEKLDENEDEI